MPVNITMPAVFKKIIESSNPNVLLYGGRLGGKTNNTAKIAVLTMLTQPYFDIVVARVSYGSLADSSYAEMQTAIMDLGENIFSEFTLKKSPLRIERKNDSGTIYFMGYGGSNTSRTKSFKSKHKIKVVILEETQELKNEQNFHEALASLRRHFGDNVRVFILGNPRPQAAHWFNKFIEKCKFDDDYLVVNITYLDILPFINDYDLKEILKLKTQDEEMYRWFYLGESTGGFGSVYPMFREEKYVITANQWDYARVNGGLRIMGCLIGGDGAVNNDATSFVPLLLLNNGQAILGPIFHHDPKQDGQLGYHQLVQDRLVFWFEDLCARFHLGTLFETRSRANMPRIPIWMFIDSAAPDLIMECRFFLGDRVEVNPVKKSTVPDMVATMQSAILNDNIIIVDYGGYYNYTKNSFVKCRTNIVAEQLSTLTWNEKRDNYDPIVPNDDCDALTYAVVSWFKNPENIQYFNIAKMINRQTLKISDILKPKKE